jgi:hypothetical protein
VPEIAQLDGQGYPVFLDMPVPPWLLSQAQQAVQMCPALALRLVDAPPPPPPPKPAKQQPALNRGGGNLQLVASRRSEPTDGPGDPDEEWIAELSDIGRQIPRPLN